MPREKIVPTGYTSGWYERKGDRVCLSYWSNDVRMIDEVSVDWYFYLSKKGFRKLRELAPEDVEELHTIQEGDFVKCYFTSDWNQRRALLSYCEANGIQTFEMDLNPLNRYLTDNDVQFEREPRILFYDLETDARAGFDHVEQHRILMVGFFSTHFDSDGYSIGDVQDYDDEWALQEAEESVLRNFLGIALQHDLLVAWNGDAYDEQVLRARMKFHKIPTWELRQINFLDQMLLFKKYYQRDASGSGIRTSFSLDNMAQTVLNKGKVKGLTTGVDSPAHAILDAWRYHPQKLIEYCLRDVQLMVEMEHKFNYIESQQVLSNLCGRFLSSWSLKSGYLNDAYVLRYAKRRDIHYPTKMGTFYDENPWADAEKIEGAYVMEPETGIHNTVCDVDFASLYPNIIRTFNISPETRIHKKTKKHTNTSMAVNGAVFDMSQEGIFPQIVTEAMRLRSQYKKEVVELEKREMDGSLEHTKATQLSNAYKVLANTMYGILASKFLRYYDPQCGEAVTKTARACIQLLIAKARASGIKALYSDTDSIFMGCGPKKAESFIYNSKKWMDDFVTETGGNPGYIRLDLDVVYERIVFIRKKGYFGLKSTGKVDVKGLEFVRSDGCKFGRDMQKRIVDYLLYVEKPNAKRAEGLVLAWKERLYGGSVGIDELKITQSLSKSVDEYKVSPPHVKVARQMLEDGDEVYLNMKIPYFLSHTEKVKGKGKQQIVKHIKHFDGSYDVDSYWDKKVYPMTEKILEIVFSKKDWSVHRAHRPKRKGS